MTSSPLVLSNRYRLDQRLAAGGMGEVWKATDELLGRSVAVKLLKQQYLADDNFRDRFRAEARFAASLQHGGIAQVYDYGEQDNLAYLVMELVPGETLSRILADRGPLSTDATLDIIGQAARALQVAHTTGIIHRDIKPANLMVTDDGIVKITDFGIARGGESTTMTQTGQVMGTAQYVSPEQATGEHITPVSDLYSLGIVAYECLAGLPPFAADTPVALALKHVREDAPPLPGHVPAAVCDLVSAMIAKYPADRPSSAQEVADHAHLIRESLAFADDVATAETRAIRAGDPARTERVFAQPRTAWAAAFPAGAGPAASDAPRRANRLALVAVCAAVLIGTGVFAAGSLWRDSGHSKLVDGNRVGPASSTAPRIHSRRIPRFVPSSHSESSAPDWQPTTPSSAPSPTTSAPTTTPTRTIKPPQRTPTTPATDPPPISPDPTTPPSTVQGPPGSEGRA
jgi:serine/threonine protein kinase